MLNSSVFEPVDYLLIGHITKDITPTGYSLGGTATYSALTAAALGLRVGIVTAYGPDLDLPARPHIQVASVPSETTTTFKNIYTPAGRIQYAYHPASRLDYSAVPEVWRNTPVVHLGPIMQEVDPKLARSFPNSLVGLTPQGWMRSFNAEGLVHYSDWPEARYVLESAQAVVFSVEDVRGDESIIEEMVSSIRVLVVTEGSGGARLYWNGDVRYFRPPPMEEVDPVGAGDIFAAAFFSRMQQTRDPWEAARFATQLASVSVTRRGIEGIPTEDEVKASLITILP
ncbi:ribokinase [bacterium]|nr:ribokinase [bacterium]